MLLDEPLPDVLPEDPEEDPEEELLEPDVPVEDELEAVDVFVPRESVR
ncbi:hypothetical protein [Cellulomonas soli]|uniref:Uncharacterized protein n=1 Tax=Cellulomonas soli TaxID=931535 RepID=A0A512PGX7_9CELL|nr:hypothetical protein [Cellulomonas soli]GEP70460.1 hypothetical protein CSO01_31750 [Cellulomonas soli]